MLENTIRLYRCSFDETACYIFFVLKKASCKFSTQNNIHSIEHSSIYQPNIPPVEGNLIASDILLLNAFVTFFTKNRLPPSLCISMIFEIFILFPNQIFVTFKLETTITVSAQADLTKIILPPPIIRNVRMTRLHILHDFVIVGNSPEPNLRLRSSNRCQSDMKPETKLFSKNMCYEKI